MKQVSVIIPTYNGLDLLKQNLASVLTMMRSDDEVLVIDDASTDISCDYLIQHYHLTPYQKNAEYQSWQGNVVAAQKKVIFTLIKNHQNLRFAASCNRAAQLSEHPYLFLLNSDVQPEKNVLDFLLPHFADSRVFAVGCHEIEAHLGNISGGKNILKFEKGLFSHQRSPEFSSGPTAWASGGSAIFDKTKWLELGGFDLDFYPAYWEDVDLSYRARRKGWQVLFEAQAIVHHNHETTNSSVFGQKQIQTISWRNAQAFTRKNSTWWQKLEYWLWWPYWHWRWRKYQQVTTHYA